MEEASENGKESPHSVHANGLIDISDTLLTTAHSIESSTSQAVSHKIKMSFLKTAGNPFSK